VEGFIALFEIIWEHTKHKGSCGCSLHGATVEPSTDNLLSYCLTNSPFRFLVHAATVNISAHTLFADGVNFMCWYCTCFMSIL